MTAATVASGVRNGDDLRTNDATAHTDVLQGSAKTKEYTNGPFQTTKQLNGQVNGLGTTKLAQHEKLQKLYSDTSILKIWQTATQLLLRENPPTHFPETVPQTGPNSGKYLCRDAEFWTCGFFPGSLYCLLERSIRYPHMFLNVGESEHDQQCRQLFRSGLLDVCRGWAEPLHEFSERTDTHDIGFIVEPALKRDYELTGNIRSLESILRAADNLASRYSDTTRAIRSWDTFVNNHHKYTSKESDFLVIIDSMCNLDLLYYAGHHTSSKRLINIATTHAHTIINTHITRAGSASGAKYPELSTCHVANMCPRTGDIVQRLTAQGYSDTSTWARGQAWAMLGFAQTYVWTKEVEFLRTACGLTEHFASRLRSAPACVEVVRNGVKTGRYVPLWDFDAPVDEKDPLRDSSAGMIAANGMLVLSNALVSIGEFDDAQRYLELALAIVQDTIALCYANDSLKLQLKKTEAGSFEVEAVADNAEESFEGLLKRATANYNENWTDKYFNHGLVYGDYYFLEFGNRLLQQGYC